jgi:hypothetical protein
MGVGELSAGQIRRSIQRFNDYARDLESADDSNFTDRLNVFVEFCRADPTISRVHQQLMGVPRVDLHSWLEESGHRREAIFPTDVESRLSLMYQVLLAVQVGKPDIINFAISAMGLSGRVDTYVAAFSTNVVRPLVRELRYRLEDIDLPPDSSQLVRASVVQVITNTGTLVQQVAPHAGQATMNTTLDHAQLQVLVKALRDAVVRADLEPAAKQNAVEVANAIAEEAASPTPQCRSA